MIGIAIRYAVAVGMHVQNNDPSASPAKKETLVRTWWSLQLVECLLSCMTGRPWVISDKQCSVPITPLADTTRGVETKSSAPGAGPLQPIVTNPSSGGPQYTFLEARVHISLIMQKTLSLLYAPLITTYSWADIQKSITSLMSQLDEWTSAALGCDYNELQPDAEFHGSDINRERLVLHFHLYSTKVLITRPCLCRLEDHTKQPQQQNLQSLNFNSTIAAACIQAAQNLTSLFPDDPQPSWMYRNGPWWCIVHNIMQAATVFLVELSKNGRNALGTTNNLATPLKKLVRWLRTMRYQDVVAHRAYKVVFDILKTSAQRNHFDINDLLAEEEAESSFLPDVATSEFHPTSWQAPEHTASFVDPAIVAGDQLQLPNDQMDYQLEFLLNHYQTPPLYGNPYATPFDSTDSEWSPSYDSFFQSQTVPRDDQAGPSKS